MSFSRKFFYFLLLLTISLNSLAYKSSLKKSFDELENGNYELMISHLESERSKDKNFLKAKYYFLGIANARLQNFEEAIKNFSLALKSNNNEADLYYELGQALYAMNDLKKSQKSFAASAENGFKTAQSNYYIAHIAQLLDNHKMAKNFFEKVISDNRASKDMRQIARFQLAETLLSMARKVKGTREKVSSFVLPQLEEALKVNNKGTTAADILKRIMAIQDEFGLNPNKYVSGKKLPEKRFDLFFSQAFEYNNNFTLTDDLPGNIQSKSDTFIVESEIDTNYSFILKRKYTLKPGLKLTKTIHTERDESSVYSSDGYEISPYLDLSLAHKHFGNPATFYLNIDYDYNAEDREGKKETIFNNRTLTFELGNKFKYFKFGNTTMKVKRKVFTSYSSTLDNKTNTVAMDQLLIKRGKVILFLFNYDMTRYDSSDTNDTNTLLLRSDFIWPSFLPKTTLNMALSHTWISYQNQATKTNKGTERNLSPSFKLTRDVSKRLGLDLEYVYSKNSSKESSSNYTSHVTTLELSYSY